MPGPSPSSVTQEGSEGFLLTESWAFTRGVRVRASLPVVALWFAVHALGVAQRGLEYQAYGQVPDARPAADAPELKFVVDNGFDLIQQAELIGGMVGWIVFIALVLSSRLMVTYVVRLFYPAFKAA